MVDSPMYVRGVTMEVDAQIPRGFKEVAGITNIAKIRLANHMLVDFMVLLKMQRVPKGQALQYYAPKTQNMMLRTLLGVMKDFYNWQIEMDDLDGFEGCLVGVTSELYKQRHKVYVRTMTLKILFYFLL